MRGPGIYDASRLTDSSIVYLRSPPKFIKMFVIFVIVFLLTTSAWASITIKSEEVKIQGKIASEDATNVFSQVNGVITTLYVEEGDRVVYGQSLLQFDSRDLEIEIEKLQTELDQYELVAGYIKTMSDQISGPNIYTNPFGSDNEIEQGYREVYAMFLQRFDIVDADQRNQLISSELQTLESQRLSNIQSMAQAETEYSKTLDELAKYNVTANASGIVHYDDMYVEGTMLQAGNKVCTINPEDSVKTVVAYISSTERAKIEVGQSCRFTVDGLPQSEFGSVNGTLVSISSDASVQEDAVVFRCEISFDATSLKGNKGYEIAIVNGMTVSAWIVYEKITYMQYFIEKLGFK